MQRQARALGNPTRHAIFRYLEAATAPVGVAELTEVFGLNHNAIRQHLAKLCEAQLVEEELAPPRGPGRRKLQYRIVPAAAGAWGGSSSYEQLALLLIELIGTNRSPREVGYEAGRRVAAPHGRRVAGCDGQAALDALEALVARQGFEPERRQRGGRTVLILQQCPYAAAASADPAVVCELHRGLAEGMADALGGGVEVEALVPRDPRRAGCRLETIVDGHEIERP